MKLSKAIITGNPGSSYQIWIVDNFDNADPVIVFDCFYDELIGSIYDRVIEENIDEIMVSGNNQAFLQGLVRQIETQVPENVTVFIGE